MRMVDWHVDLLHPWHTELREFGVSCFSLGSSRGSNPGVIKKWELAADDVFAVAAAAAADDGDTLRCKGGMVIGGGLFQGDVGDWSWKADE